MQTSSISVCARCLPVLMVTFTVCCCWALYLPESQKTVQESAARLPRSVVIIPQISKEEWMAASLHYQRIIRQAPCKVPFPRLVRVKDVYQDRPHKTYKPHCTVLHRCSNETGCCGNDAKKCVPRSEEQVKLYFQVEELFPNGTRVMKAEGLLFTNHTECMCDDKNDLPR